MNPDDVTLDAFAEVQKLLATELDAVFVPLRSVDETYVSCVPQ